MCCVRRIGQSDTRVLVDCVILTAAQSTMKTTRTLCKIRLESSVYNIYRFTQYKTTNEETKLIRAFQKLWTIDGLAGTFAAMRTRLGQQSVSVA